MRWAALDERQQCEFRRQAAALDFVDDEVKVAAGAQGDGLHKFWTCRVPRNLLGNQLSIEIGNGEAEANAFPKVVRAADEKLFDFQIDP